MQKRGIETRDAILKAGEYLFSTKGFYKTNSKMIAKQARIAIGSFYTYFNDKKEVLMEILKKHNEQIFQNMRGFHESRVPNLSDPLTYFREIINNVIDSHQVMPGFHEQVVFLTHTDPDVKEIMNTFTERQIKMTEKVMEAMSGKLNIHDIKLMAELITTLIEETVHYIIFSKKNENKQKLVDELAIMLSRYLLKNEN